MNVAARFCAEKIKGSVLSAEKCLGQGFDERVRDRKSGEGSERAGLSARAEKTEKTGNKRKQPE